jgi:hypothetical protein
MDVALNLINLLQKKKKRKRWRWRRWASEEGRCVKRSEERKENERVWEKIDLPVCKIECCM